MRQPDTHTRRAVGDYLPTRFSVDPDALLVELGISRAQCAELQALVRDWVAGEGAPRPMARAS